MEIQGKDDFENFSPKEIDGLNETLLKESFGGNSGEHSGSVNFYYKDGQMIPWTGKTPEDSGRYPQAAIRTRGVPIREMVRIASEKRPIPPPLIDLVIPTNADEDTKVYFIQRAIEHNSKMLLDYVSDGGRPEDLPKTKLILDLEDLI